ncbi:MAG: hypothetical protein ABI633_05000 [Burkholderiales bacterium]
MALPTVQWAACGDPLDAATMAACLLHQAVQNGLFGAVALIVDWGTIGRPAALPIDGST